MVAALARVLVMDSPCEFFMLKRVRLRRVAPVRKVARRRAGLPREDRDRLDRLARELTMLRANAGRFDNPEPRQPSWWGQCQKCGRARWLSWCHVISRANFHVRWDADNAFAWCAGCHRTLDQHWEQKQAWVEQHIGPARWAMLLLRSRAKGRLDYAAIRVALEQERRRLLPHP